MDDGHHGQEAEADEYRPGPHLHAVRRDAAQQYRSLRQNKSGHSDWSALDDHLALRCQTLRPAQHRERRRRVGDVRWPALRLSACLRFSVNRQRVLSRSGPDLDDALWQAIGTMTLVEP